MKSGTKITIGAISLLAITLYFVFKNKKSVGEIVDSKIDETSRDKMITNINQLLNPDDLTLNSGEKFSSLVKKMSDIEISTLNDFANFQKDQTNGTVLQYQLLVHLITSSNIRYTYSEIKFS
jgi:hypothetical protein